MLNVIRYALAAVCIAASVGCLSLWWRGHVHRTHLRFPGSLAPAGALYLEAYDGAGSISLMQESLFMRAGNRKPINNEELRAAIIEDQIRHERLGRFGRSAEAIYFPLWYPSLVFALAAIAAMRVGRRFTLRSTLVATTIVAALLGMVAAL